MKRIVSLATVVLGLAAANLVRPAPLLGLLRKKPATRGAGSASWC